MPALRFKPLTAAASFLLSAAALIAAPASAQDAAPLVAPAQQTASFDIPAQDLQPALSEYARQSGQQLLYAPELAVGKKSHAVSGDLSPAQALHQLLEGTGLYMESRDAGAVLITDQAPAPHAEVPARSARHQAAADAAPEGKDSTKLETVVVTAQKRRENVQNVPIAITVLSQEQLTSRQIAGGPDLIKEVPNLTFSKTNFTGANIQIRGIGTQAVSVTTDPAVAVAFNGIPFIRNHFFEQEFYDVSNVEILRGPQGTLYGRNATAGVINLVSAKASDKYAAMASVDIGNYNNRRLEGMLNLPIVGNKLGLRLAGEWTKRDGYEFNEQTNSRLDGRDLWSGRATLSFHPVEALRGDLIYEHFSEDDDRARSTKQLCQRDPGPSVVNGPAGPQVPDFNGNLGAAWLSQGCLPGSLYASSAYQTPNAGSNPFVTAGYLYGLLKNIDPYASVAQSHDLRVISSALQPRYQARNDTLVFNADYTLTPSLTLTSQTGYGKDRLYSTEDYNRFNSAPGEFLDTTSALGGTLVGQDGQYCDPQLGCSDRLVGEDVSEEHAEQISQELRLASNFAGPLNFSVGANYLHYRTLENYAVYYNAISIFTEADNTYYGGAPLPTTDAPHIPFDPVLANSCGPLPAGPGIVGGTGGSGLGCTYIDPNSLSQVDGQGHNYFRSQNPYRLHSLAGFGELYYQLTPDVKLTGGLRWTDDHKSFTEIPSWTLVLGKGYPTAGVLDQGWKEWTGRFNATWTPKLAFTDQSMFYASYSRGYKGGGANPPGVVTLDNGNGGYANSPSNETHPQTFKPEFVNAFELGTKNTLLDGTMTLNANVFMYKYQNYQISQIVDRTAVNSNYNATVKGAELETTWAPVTGLRLNAAAGYEDATLDQGSQAIDLMDRTAGHPGWMVVKPFITQTSNCILPTDVVNELMAENNLLFGCQNAYAPFLNWDPVTSAPYVPNPPTNAAGQPTPGYAGFNPLTAPNGGQGFTKDLSGNKLPNTPPFTLSLGAQYSMPISLAWIGTLRGDFYWQGDSFARIYNDKPYDQLKGYTNLNLSLVLDNTDQWQAMFYVKNVLNTTAITGAFLNSDDSALTTNVFTTDPRLFGMRITKKF